MLQLLMVPCCVVDMTDRRGRAAHLVVRPSWTPARRFAGVLQVERADTPHERDLADIRRDSRPELIARPDQGVPEPIPVQGRLRSNHASALCNWMIATLTRLPAGTHTP